MSARKARKTLAERLTENHDRIMNEHASQALAYGASADPMVGHSIILALKDSSIESLPAQLCPLLP